MLGRPFHKLPQFTHQLHDELQRYFQVDINRRYRASFSVTSVNTRFFSHEAGGLTYHFQATETGASLGIHIDRALMLTLLELRYGGKSGPITDAALNAPATETEHRFATQLGHRLLELTARCINRQGKSMASDSHNLQKVGNDAISLISPEWAVDIVITDSANEGRESRIQIVLDQAWLAHLLDKIASHRQDDRRVPDHTTGMARKIPLTMTARLLEKSFQLGEIMDLRQGTVIPVSVGPQADIIIGDSRVFKARIAEESGKLWITAFEDIE